MLREALTRLVDRVSLSEDEAHDLLIALTDETQPTALSASILTALRTKGESADEVRGFATAMRKLARDPGIDAANAVDIVGTGGDRSGSFNLSTGAALLTAACGQVVVKHGNRSVSSQSGSADVLEVLGLPMPMDLQNVRRCLEASRFTFLFAPYFHPAMKAVAPVRQAMGIRTIFNILGPLTNPAAPGYYVLGAYSLAMAELMAEALSGLPITRAFVVHGHNGWDEATPVSPFTLFDVTPNQVTRQDRDPRDIGLERCQPDDLRGGDSTLNASILTDIFQGKMNHGRHSVALGAALALEVTGVVPNERDALAAAYEGIDSGKAAAVLDHLAPFRTTDP